VSHEPRIQQLADDFARTGHHPFHLPVGIDLDETDPERGRCVRCDRFDGFPCLTDGKADAHVRCIRPALEHPNVTLLRHAKVERLEADAAGRRVTGVVTEKGTFSADLVVVSCGAVNSAALLLRSGLANSSDQVGRNYMAHLNSGVIAISKEPNPTMFQKTLGVNDYYWGAPDSELPLGHIQMLGKSDREVIREGSPLPAPGFVLDYVASHAVDFWLTSEDLPHAENRVTVDRHGRVHVAYTDRNLEGHRRLIAKLKHLLPKLGCHETLIPNQLIRDGRIPLAGVAHQCGTVRFGTHPETSALDVNCKAHDHDNLYVVDTSFFPSSSAVNPALTAMANALRVGDHLVERLGAATTAKEEVMAS
jgi:choline dehydrogenase-like flavoprotein